MNIYIALLMVGLLPTLVTLFLPKKKDFFENKIVRGVGLGVYTALIFVLLRETFENGEVSFGIGGLLFGLLVSFFIGYYFKEFHHHHEESENHIHTKVSYYKILISDFAHNIVDGIAIVTGFKIGGTIGLTSLIGVLGHQIIQQSGQQILLVTEGVKPMRAIFYSFIISLSVFIALLLKDGESIEGILMAFSAGIIMFKIITDIKETKWTSNIVLGFFLGFFILTLSLVLIPHLH